MTAAKKTVRAKGPRDDMEKLMSKINAGRPKTAKARAIMDFEVVRSTKRIPSKVKYVLTTGIEAYDEATGIGGLPLGRIVESYGTDGSGKSAMAQLCAARMQQRHIYERVRDENDVARLQRIPLDAPVFTIYIDNEQSMDDDAKLVVDGVQLDMMVARCDTINQMFKIMDTTITGVEELARESGVEHYVLVVCDTLAGTSSEEEMVQAWGKVDYPRQAQQLRAGFRTMTRKLSRSNVLMIATNQVGDKFEKARQQGKPALPQDSDFNTFGGRACKFFASLRTFHTVASLNYKLHREQKFPSGRSIEFHIVKNRFGKPGRRGRMVLLYEGGLSNTFSTLETFLFLKLAEYGDAEAGDRSIKFRFKKHGIETTTFPPPEAGGRERSPQIDALHEWPAFYAEHKADFDLLWQKAKDIMFLEAVPVVEEDDPELASEVDVEED
jgi:RecA/RadA recombinase